MLGLGLTLFNAPNTFKQQTWTDTGNGTIEKTNQDQ
jgi:hypothetical protein